MTLPTIEQLEAMLANVPPKPWTVAFRSDGSAYCSFGGSTAGAHLQINIGLDWDGRFDKHIAALIALAPTLAAQRIADAKRIAELEAEIERLTNTTAGPVVKATHYSVGLCGCCGVRPIAYSIAGECIDCFSANEASDD